jgi:hypothetical protein
MIGGFIIGPYNGLSARVLVVATGIPPSDDRESAVVSAFAAGGSYTVILRGRNGTTGVGLIEIYRLE